ncbi:MAG: 4Fe-4S binding protein [Microscillaceae bacterium]|nr:4Fe-4S binding protein [Microscillaceae bacterium]MDW8461748.1 4Fe-4S binding protein [Cytophagales bacterium]
MIKKQKKGANNTYWGSLWEGIKTSWRGLQLSFKHLKNARFVNKPFYVTHEDYFKQNQGIVTLQYPHEAIAIPDNGRYRLYNEIEDCIVCDKCAKICPVDCIDIEAIKATEQIGTTSDGSPIRLYAAKFDIDMAKCCYCGLCTTVCPTECLTMSKVYDFSEYEITNMIYHFSNLTPEQAAEKKRLLEQFQKEKETLKAQKASTKTEEKLTEVTQAQQPTYKPKFVPKIKPIAQTTETPTTQTTENETKSKDKLEKPKPKFIPKMRPADNPKQENSSATE